MNKYHSEIICLVPTAKMKKNKTRELLLLSLASCVVIVQGCACFAGAVPFADNGTLKMLYDNRMHPQALEHDGSVYIVWRGEKGFPYIISYDLESRKFSRPSMLLAGMEEKVDAQKYKKDHHFSPVIWIDSEGYKYQNIKFVSREGRETADGLILFYGWQESNGDGTTFLLDDRE